MLQASLQHSLVSASDYTETQAWPAQTDSVAVRSTLLTHATWARRKITLMGAAALQDKAKLKG